MFTASHVRCLFEDCGLKVLIPFSINLAPKDLVNVANTSQLGIGIIDVKVFSLQKRKMLWCELPRGVVRRYFEDSGINF